MRLRLRLDFEGAAALHVRLDKVKAATAQLPEIVRRLDELNGVMIQPSAEADSVALFKIAAGRISDPVRLDLASKAEAAHMQARPQSMEARITEALAAVEAPKLQSALEWMEHLALLKRWYYRTVKDGRTVSDGQQWRVADAARGARRVAGVQGREAGGRSERDGGRLLEVPGGGGWGETVVSRGFARIDCYSSQDGFSDTGMILPDDANTFVIAFAGPINSTFSRWRLPSMWWHEAQVVPEVELDKDHVKCRA